MNNKPIILFDGVCNLCNASVQFILRHEKKGTVLFSSLQSEFGKRFIAENNLKADYLDTIILIEDNNIYLRSKAILHIAKYLKLPFNLLYYLNIFPKKFLDYFYTIISKNRYKIFGKKENCYLPGIDLSHRFIE